MSRRPEAGQALVFVALMLVVILGVMALAIDTGFQRLTKRRLQNAADAAAVAGALEISSCQNGFGCGDPLVQAAQTALTENGLSTANLVTTTGCIPPAVTALTIAVNNPPSCEPAAQDPHNGDNNYVEVMLAEKVTNHFASMFGTNSTVITTRGEAKVSSGPNCVYALNGLTNVGIVNVSCGVVIENPTSGCPPLLLTATQVSCVAPKPADPLAYLPALAPGGCITQGPLTGATVTLNPGTYCGGLSISASTVTFNPGTYIINGGGLTVTASTLLGDGVTFYNTGSGVGACGTCYGAITFIGLLPTSTLSAPTSGTYEGILFFQDRNNPLPASFGATIALTGDIAGAYYFPDANLSFVGSVDLGVSAPYTVIVANNILFSVLMTINDNYSSLTDGSPIQGGAVLVE